MLSFRKGTPVAVVCTGNEEGRRIFIAPDDGAPEQSRDPEEVLDIAPSKTKVMSVQERMTIRRYLSSEPAVDAVMAAHIEKLQRELAAKNRYEYFSDDGTLCVLPSKHSERVYVAGKSGAGKSTFTAQYIREYQEMFKERRVILFSTHDDEKAYRKLNITQVELDAEFVENPPTLDELAECLVVFDDTDNLQDKKLQAVINGVNADLLANGRKYNIHVITLAHQLMDYGRSRTLLNEANRVVFFNGGSAYHIQRYMKVYAGLEPKQIRRILNSKSRWTCIGLTLPNYVINEHEVYIIRPGS
jgi:hypothetical protein